MPKKLRVRLQQCACVCVRAAPGSCAKVATVRLLSGPGGLLELESCPPASRLGQSTPSSLHPALLAGCSSRSDPPQPPGRRSPSCKPVRDRLDPIRLPRRPFPPDAHPNLAKPPPSRAALLRLLEGALESVKPACARSELRNPHGPMREAQRRPAVAVFDAPHPLAHRLQPPRQRPKASERTTETLWL